MCTCVLVLAEASEIAEKPRASKRRSEAVEVGEDVLQRRRGRHGEAETEDVDFSDRVVHLVQPDRGQEDEESAVQNSVDKLVPKKLHRLLAKVCFSFQNILTFPTHYHK